MLRIALLMFLVASYMMRYGRVALQREALTDFGQACGSDTWKKPGSPVYSNWCDGLVANNECTLADVVYDPCTGLVMQTSPLQDAVWSYTYSDSHAWNGVTCEASSGMVTDLGLSDFRVKIAAFYDMR